MTSLRFLAMSGSLRAASLNTAALRAAAELAPQGTTIQLGSIADIPLYNDDIRAAGLPAPVAALQAAISAADAVLIATPEYNYSVPGVLKNAIDWLSRTDPQPFRNKPVAILGVSPGAIGTARAQYDLRKSFVFLDAHVLNRPEVMIGAAATRFDATGSLTDQATRAFLASMLEALRDWTLRLRSPAPAG
jgi:chromate reductase